MHKAAKPQGLSTTGNPSQVMAAMAWFAIVATGAALLLLATLHVLSPEFSPSWRMISEYAFGHYAWMLSLMFLCWGIGSWALVIAIWSQVHTRGGMVGLWLLIGAGVGSGKSCASFTTMDTSRSCHG